MDSLFFPGNFLVFCLNILHVLVYLDLRRDSRWRIAAGALLLLLPLIVLPPVGATHGLAASLLGGPAFILCYGVPVLRLLVFRGSFGRIAACVFATVSFTHVMLVGGYLGLYYFFGVPAGAELYIYARLAIIPPSVFFFLLFRKYVRQPFRSVLDSLESRRWYAGVVGVFFLFLLGFLAHTAFMNAPGGMTLALALIAVAVIISAYWSLYFVVMQTDRNRYLADTIAGAEKMRAMYESYNSLLERKEADIRTLRHDFRHSLIVIGDMAEKKDAEGILRQLRSLDKTSGAPLVAVHSENVPMKALLTFYFSRAAESGTACSSSISLPARTPLPEAELVLLAGNALENCLKATAPLGEKGFIDVHAAELRGCLAFRFRNNFRPGEYAAGEGLGIASIRALCERYDGTLEINRTADEYTLTAIVQIAGETRE